MSALDVAGIVLGVEIEGGIGDDEGYHVMRAVRRAVRLISDDVVSDAEIGFEVNIRNFPAISVKIRGTESIRRDTLPQLAQRVGAAVNLSTGSPTVICLVYQGGEVVAHWSSQTD